MCEPVANAQASLMVGGRSNGPEPLGLSGRSQLERLHRMSLARARARNLQHAATPRGYSPTGAPAVSLSREVALGRGLVKTKGAPPPGDVFPWSEAGFDSGTFALRWNVGTVTRRRAESILGA